jgi:hypothetical protein
VLHRRPRLPSGFRRRAFSSIPATTIQGSFGRPVYAFSKALSIQFNRCVARSSALQ